MMSLSEQKLEKIKFLEDCKISDLAKSSKTSSLASLVLVFAYFISISSGEKNFLSYYQLAACAFLTVALSLRLLHTFNTQNLKWLTNFTIFSTLVAMGWSAAFLSAILEESENLKVLLVTFAVITGIVSSAVYSLAISKRDFIIFVIMAFIPIYYKLNTLDYDASFQVAINVILSAFILFLANQQRQIEDTWTEQRMINFELKKLMNLFPGGIAVLKEGLYLKTNIYFDQIIKQKSTNTSVQKLIQSIYQFSVSKHEGRHQWQTEVPIQGEMRTHLVITENRESLNGPETVVTIVDIEDYTRIEKENQIQRASLEQSAKMAALGVMSSGIAHEINNPLAIILARVQLMQTQLQSLEPDPKTEKITSSIQIIDQAVKRISKIIKSLQSFSRESSKDPMELVSLFDVIEMTLSLCESKIKSAGVKLESSVDPSIKVSCRPVEISQVLLNALNNSLHAVSGATEKWIKLEAEVSNHVVEIKITDSGHGIEESLREKVMIPFFTTKDVGSGTGLGLSLSKGIIESHGGQFYFEHRGPNTQLVIELPVQQS